LRTVSGERREEMSGIPKGVGQNRGIYQARSAVERGRGKTRRGRSY